jgi:hypothetical protein
MRTFFGLTNEYIEGVYEEIFNLKMHGNWSFMEAYNLPIKIRRWFLKRLLNITRTNQKRKEEHQENIIDIKIDQGQ